jgi:guanosine-3',5'-bis(diphosphate) 3'-pyrophosphohydrolase
MGDKISNLRSLAKSPPTDWSQNWIAEYCVWATKVAEGCVAAHPGLTAQFYRALAELATPD